MTFPANGSNRRLSGLAPAAALIAALAAGVGLPGCVKRTIMITSDPSGALVWVNDHEVGRTPVDFSFVHYGDYDVRLVKDGYEPLLTMGAARVPWWDHVGVDLVAELLPVSFESALVWHYDLEPVDPDPVALRAAVQDRARDLRARLLESSPDDE